MKCGFCGHEETRVVNSRPDREGNTIRRRRECDECKRRFTTYELREELTPTILKKDGTSELFDRNKLIRSLQIASSKCSVTLPEIEAFVSELEQSMQDRFQGEVKSRVIGDQVMTFLHERDHVAYVRYASVYREFRDVHEFVDAVSKLRDEPDDELTVHGGDPSTGSEQKTAREPTRDGESA
jgi:transcriptional repressor NrdR